MKRFPIVLALLFAACSPQCGTDHSDDTDVIETSVDTDTDVVLPPADTDVPDTDLPVVPATAPAVPAAPVVVEPIKLS